MDFSEVAPSLLLQFLFLFSLLFDRIHLELFSALPSHALLLFQLSFGVPLIDAEAIVEAGF